MDRFHLLLNLGEAVEYCLCTRTGFLRQHHWGNELPALYVGHKNLNAMFMARQGGGAAPSGP